MTRYRLTRRGVAVVMLATVAWLIACGIVAATDATDSTPRDYLPCVTPNQSVIYR